MRGERIYYVGSDAKQTAVLQGRSVLAGLRESTVPQSLPAERASIPTSVKSNTFCPALIAGNVSTSDNKTYYVSLRAYLLSNCF